MSGFGLDRLPAVIFGLVCLAVAAGASARELTLERVMLSTGGVAYFEHEAVVDGDAELTLDVRLDQVDNVLKSLVVFDSEGRVGAVRLPGRAPLAQTFRDLPFGPEALGSLVGLLQALPGAEIAASGARDVRGRLIGVGPETVALPDGQGTVTRHRVSLMTAEGVRQFLLEEASAVTFTDRELQDQVTRALDAIARHRVQDRRRLVLDAPGTGRRTVRVGYVAEVPLWKASYRLSLEAQGARGRLQGWAVIENMSGRDWRDVELTLTSGNPVTFRQALYTAYYVERPEVPVTVLGRVLPRADQGAVATEAEVAGAEQFREEGRRRRASAKADFEADEVMAQAPVPPAPLERSMHRFADLATAVAREEAATQVIFRVAEPVRVDAGQSLVVPIVDDRVGAERVSLYQPETHALHPLASVRLLNTTGTGLPPGALTLYERDGRGAAAYVGDARFTTLPAGETRLLSFAIDQKVRVDRETRSARSILKGAISRGTLRLRVRESQTTTYRLKPPAEENRQLLIEHPRRPGWDLVRPDPKDSEATDTHYRIPVALAAGKDAAVAVVLERPVQETIAIGDLDRARLDAYARSSELAPALRAALRRVAELRAEVETLQARVQAIEEERQRLFADQERLRENLRRVPSDSDLYGRYLEKLGLQEDRVETLERQERELRAALAKAEAALADYVRDLDI